MHLQILYLAPYLSLALLFASILFSSCSFHADRAKKFAYISLEIIDEPCNSVAQPISLRTIRLVRRKLLISGDDEVPPSLVYSRA